MSNEELVSLETSEFFQRFRDELDGELTNSMNGVSASRLPAWEPPARSSNSNSDEVSDKLGQKLLAGWCMLGVHCPVCATPIMKSKQGEMYCVACDLPVMHEADTKADASEEDTSTNVSPVEEEQEDKDELMSLAREPVMTRDMQEHMRRVDDISAKLGEYMLRGWALTDVHCSSDDCTCPLVKSKTGEMLCVSCNNMYVEGEPVAQTKEEAAPTPEESRSNSRKHQSGFRFSRRDYASDDSEDERDSDSGKRSRVAAVEEEKLQAKQRRQPESSSSASLPTSTTSSSASSSSSSPASAPSSSFSSPSTPPPSHHQAMTETEQILVQKLAWCKEQLAQSTSLSAMQEQAKLIKELVAALSAIQGFKSM